MILVDTSIWSLALRRRPGDLNTIESGHVREWGRLVREGVVVLIGPIRQELLSGVRDANAWEKLRTALRPFPDLPLEPADYERAAQFFNRCRARDIAASAIDILMCAVAARHEVSIYTLDADFRRYAPILGLELHAPHFTPKASR